MKFELEPNNRGASDSDLVDDILRTSQKLGKYVLTIKEYTENGRFSGDTVAKRFGSWNNALEKAGIRLNRQTKVSIEDCLTDLIRVSKTLNNNVLTLSEYEKIGKYERRIFVRRFGSWLNAIKKAGLLQTEKYQSRISEEDLFKNMEAIWIKIGRQPRTSDLIRPHTKYSNQTYKNRFGSWRKALEAFVSFVNKEIKDEIISEKKNEIINDKQPVKFKKTSRSISSRMRFIIMRRDNFTCKICGLTPALQPGITLEIDHVIPYSNGGETESDNLQTLCQKCNIGKSDLSIKS